MSTRITFILLSSLVLPNHAFAQTYLDEWGFNVRISDGAGSWINTTGTIDLRNPDKDDDVGFGTVVVYTAQTGEKTNCNNDGYSYYVISLDEGWHGHLSANYNYDQVGPEDAERFWDWNYEGYEKLSGLDVSQNCHGYSFGVGDWPVTATGPLGLGPFLAGSGKTPCYGLAPRKDATIAVDFDPILDQGVYGLKHSIKVKGTECEVEEPGPQPTGVGGDGPVTIKKQALIESLEQFRFSGIYRQTATCPDNVNLSKAHINPPSFALFKRNQ